MAGPNDVGVLRGIIGDGQSMNDEEMKEKVLGRRPGNKEKKDLMKMPIEKAHLTNSQRFNTNNALDYFTGKGKSQNSPVQSMKYFTGQNKVQTVSPTAALDYFTGRNNIRVDTRSKNMNKEQALEMVRGVNKKKAELDARFKNKYGDTNKKETTRITEKTIPIERQREVAEAQAGALKAQAQQRQMEAERTTMPPLDRSQQVVRLTGREYQLPQLFTSAEKNPRAGAGDILDATKGALGIISGKQNLVVAKTPSRFQAEYTVPTRAGLKGFAQDLAENLGPSIASQNSFIGPFESQGGPAQIRGAQASYNAYVQTLHKRHKTTGNPALLNARATEAEKIKLEKLRGTISLRQQQVGSAGFLGGQGGAAVLIGSRPRGSLNRFTELGGAFTRQSYGNYGPEASAQLGVGQGLQADQPNKWGVLLGQNTGTDKITQILGKRPDPTGESQSGKIQRLAGPMPSGEDAAAKIKRLSGM